MKRAPGELFVGETTDPESGDRTGEAVLLDSADFTTHGVIVGMTGSGKTGLGIVLLEEALTSGIPVLAIDPKGDLGNLALTFPQFRPRDFEPWIDEGAARMQRTTVADLAAQTADRWRSGLASWALDGADVERLRAAARPVIYTPGSTAGVQLNALGSLAVPSSGDPSVRQDEADATVSGLLGLVGIDSDPLSGREHILLSNLIMRSWGDGRDLDLATLLGQVIDPPMRKLGVLDLDTFFPATDRRSLAMRLNGLLASPSFAAWAEGEPIDLSRMLWDPDGEPRAAVVSLAHLDDAERQFAVTLLLSRLISWMRAQSGTSELRVLVYVDEVMGLAPPLGNPPAKKPILTLLKQARAYGVGLVLSTQNPVDLDYKAISNAGTWMIGRLQTEQDKNRLVDGLRGADGATNIAAVEQLISGLGTRQFVLRTTRSDRLPLFTTRWAMSYLAGPMTRDQISRLMADQRAVPGTSTTQARSGPTAAGGRTERSAHADSSTVSAADDESPIPPEVPDELPVRHVHPSASWLADVGASAGGHRLRPALAARVRLLFDDAAADLRHTEEWEAIIPLSADRIDIDTAVAVDYDDRDLTTSAPDGARYVSPAFNLTATALRSARTDLRNKLYAEEQLELFTNRELRLWSRPGETEQHFLVRCLAVAEDGADTDSAKIRDTIAKRRDRLEAALARAEDRVDVLETEREGRRSQSLVDLGTSVLGGLLGGRNRTRELATAARRIASGRRRTATADARLATAEHRVAEKVDELDELEAELATTLIEIDDAWRRKAEAIDVATIPLEKRDITIDELVLVWLPTAG